MFDLKRPCMNCPFRKGVGSTFRLPSRRLMEIEKAQAFQCHKTVDYDHEHDPVAKQGANPQQCAGLMAVLHRENHPSQIMQVATRLGELDPDQLDPLNEAYDDWAQVCRAHLLGGEPD